ncbi:MAG: hypothetical protein K0B15_16365 [Lentimicrobium sp.]|nr:hypothetical protein [Lentimicrobium sp.]
MHNIKFVGLPHLWYLRLDKEIILSYLKGTYSRGLVRDTIVKFDIRSMDFLESLDLKTSIRS